MSYVAARPRQLPLTASVISGALLLIVTQGIAESERREIFKPLPQKRAEPVKITSMTLEWNEKANVATFSGNVHVVQGDADLRSNTLVVFYDGKNDQSVSRKPADGGQVRRMEAHGSVVITQKCQRATGDRADFDVRANTVTVSGNVVVAKGEEVLRGPRLFMDLTTGITRMDGGQIAAVVNSKSRQEGC